MESRGIDRTKLINTAIKAMEKEGSNIQAYIAKMTGKEYSQVSRQAKEALGVILGGVKVGS